MNETGAARNGWRAHAFALTVLSAMALYVAFALSPSSFGALFDEFGVERAGLVAGEPRPIRADEFRRWTPFMQIAVNNDFARINESSPYREDLRNVEGLPLADWGLAFKPYFWPFFLVDPARAFSFYHAFWIAACLIGYERLLRAFRFRPAEAALGSLAIFFTGFFQTWWTTYGPVVGGFPWLVLVWLAPMPAMLRVAAATYVTVAWALASLYPPIEVTTAFVAGITILAWRRDALAPRRLVPFAAGVAVGGATAFLYYREVFATMANTVYPGLRRAGGGGVPFEQWISHFIPSFVIRGHEGLVNENVCEAATVGSFLPLLLLCFVDWRDFAQRLRARDEEGSQRRLEIGVLAAGAGLTSLWLLAPVPSVLGMPLLWHLVPGKRMWFAAGLTIFLLALGVLRNARLELTWLRAAAAAAAALSMSWLTRETLDGAPVWDPATTALVVSVGLLVALRDRVRGWVPAALLACAAVANFTAFGTFNPLQSAVPIFHPPEIPLRASLDRLASRHEQNWLVMKGSDGAWPNMFGYSSVSHVLYAPQLEFFRRLFPSLPESEFQNLFNRTFYPFLSGRTRPELIGDAAMLVPIEVFDPPRIDVQLSRAERKDMPRAGMIENVWVYRQANAAYLFVDGWARMDGSDPATRLSVATRLPVASATAYPWLRGDVARKLGDPTLALSGFEIRLTLATPATNAAIASEPLCVVSESPTAGRFLLHGSSRSCPSP
jgi:hypothetical protein